MNLNPLAIDLEKNWLPRLIRLWRRLAKTRGESRAGLEASEAKSIAAGIRRLSAGLVGERGLAGEAYFRDPGLAGAYLLYFWPVSYVQARLALNLLPQPPESVLELGGGGGPLSAACRDLGAKRAFIFDRSSRALEWAATLLQESGMETGVRQQDLAGCKNSGVWPSGSFDVIADQHALNELPESAGLEKIADQAFGHLNPGGRLLLIEPALKITSQRLLLLRDRLAAAGRGIDFPCPHTTACPALAGQDSCHAEADWTPPEIIQNLIQRAGLQKRSLKMTILMFAATAAEGDASPFRVISDVRRAADRSLYAELCGAGGRVDLVLPAKASHHPEMKKLKPGDLIRVRQALPHARGLALGPDSALERLEAASELRILA